jgi:phage gpG-like protein
MQFVMNFQVDHLDRALTAARQAISHPEALLGSVGESLLRVNRDRHNAGLAPDGSKWKELSPLTLGSAIWKKQGETFRNNGQMSLAVAKKVQSRKSRILYDSGDMLNSFSYRVAGDTLTLGFDGARESRLAAWHHSGTKPYVISPKKAKALAFGGFCVKRVNHPGLPSRKLVGFSDPDRKLTADVVEDYLKVILNRVR